MVPIFRKRYTPKEQEYLAIIQGMAPSVQMARQLLDQCIKEADKLGFRGYDKRGDELIKDEAYVSRRVTAGLTPDDILAFWNRDFVWLLAEEKLQNVVRMAVFSKNKPIVGTERAALVCRKMFIYYGDQEKPQGSFVGEDADIYYEFA